MNPYYAAVAERAGHRCEYCRAPEAIFNCAFEVEHITPKSRSGSDDVANLALSCRVCNLRKSARLTGIDPESQATVSLFHPRTDSFDEHFRIDVEQGVISGLTPVGRATVACLDFNSPAQIRARLQWVRLGIYP
jgi:hypothetical protein